MRTTTSPSRPKSNVLVVANMSFNQLADQPSTITRQEGGDSVVSWIWITRVGMDLNTAGAAIAQGVLAHFQIMRATPTITTLMMTLITGSAITVTGHHTVIMAITMAITVIAQNIYWK